MKLYVARPSPFARKARIALLDLRAPEVDWRHARPGLVALQARLEARPSFAATRPAVQDLPAS